MAAIKFQYKKEPISSSEAFPQRTSISRPIIPIQIEYKGKKVGYEVLVDSGADWNLFHSVIGEIIGIDITSGKKLEFHGIGGGRFTAFFHNVKVYIGGREHDLYCGFSPDIPGNYSRGVLGHSGFFDSYVVKFETPKKELEIKRII